ncbi:mitochondrial metalloendopeptidase OMA1-like [Cornus florida]|uniref:mitochondrial metalloendopeptidase OMA1-like n=1 Tax=Cornus florida TaxID=4283 RepID=UPI00289E65A0|nr:mitochondrial metalloendopeptidase OMA1-like [Cornus florida]
MDCLERVPYSKRIRMVTPSHIILERLWREDPYILDPEIILPSTHPQSVRVQSILRDIVQGMHTGLGLNRHCYVSSNGSEDALLVSREYRKRPKESIIKFGTSHLEGLNWEVMLVESHVVNAEYHNNGKIVVYTGILDYCNSDIDIATFLAHEVGHGVAWHVSEYLVIYALVRPFYYVPKLSIIADRVYKYILRRGELEADYIGLMLMASAGYDPQVAPYFYERICDYKEDLFETHPSGETRARSLQQNEVMGEAMEIYKGVRSRHEVKSFV